MSKKELQKILYKNYEPVKGLGADEIDIAIDQILELFQAQKQELAEEIEFFKRDMEVRLHSEPFEIVKSAVKEIIKKI